MSAKRSLSDIPGRLVSLTGSDTITQTRRGGTQRLLYRALSGMDVETRTAVLRDPASLREELATRGVPEPVTDRLCLLSRTRGYDSLWNRDRPLLQPQLENFIYQAVRTTGLQQMEVLSLVSDITRAMNTAFSIRPESAREYLRKVEKMSLPEPPSDSADPAFPGPSREARETQKAREMREAREERYPPAFTVPVSFYADELENIRAQFALWQSDSGQEPPEGTLRTLRALSAMGLPEAQYYLGICLLRGKAGGTEKERHTERLKRVEKDLGLQWLERAALRGNADAAAALGDEYYQRGKNWGNTNLWNKAFYFYTEYGAQGLSREQRSNVLDILGQRHKNQLIFRLSVVLSALITLFALVVPFLISNPPLAVIGCICAVFSTGCCVRFAAFHKDHPYDHMEILLALILIAAILYLLLAILL